MKHDEFRIGQQFRCGGRRWRCTDVGSRVIAAICLEPHEVVTVETDKDNPANRREYRSMTDDPSWLIGPAYKVAEEVFDEYDIEGCSLTAQEDVGTLKSSRLGE
jgi:hypothetical protein